MQAALPYPEVTYWNRLFEVWLGIGVFGWAPLYFRIPHLIRSRTLFWWIWNWAIACSLVSNCLVPLQWFLPYTQAIWTGNISPRNERMIELVQSRILTIAIDLALSVMTTFECTWLAGLAIFGFVFHHYQRF